MANRFEQADITPQPRQTYVSQYVPPPFEQILKRQQERQVLQDNASTLQAKLAEMSADVREEDYFKKKDFFDNLNREAGAITSTGQEMTSRDISKLTQLGGRAARELNTGEMSVLAANKQAKDAIQERHAQAVAKGQIDAGTANALDQRESQHYIQASAKYDRQKAAWDQADPETRGPAPLPPVTGDYEAIAKEDALDILLPLSTGWNIDGTVGENSSHVYQDPNTKQWFRKDTKGERVYIDRNDVVSSMKKVLQNNPDWKRYMAQQVEIGHMTQADVDDAEDAAVNVMAEKIGFSRESEDVKITQIRQPGGGKKENGDFTFDSKAPMVVEKKYETPEEGRNNITNVLGRAINNVRKGDTNETWDTNDVREFETKYLDGVTMVNGEQTPTIVSIENEDGSTTDYNLQEMSEVERIDFLLDPNTNFQPSFYGDVSDEQKLDIDNSLEKQRTTILKKKDLEESATQEILSKWTDGDRQRLRFTTETIDEDLHEATVNAIEILNLQQGGVSPIELTDDNINHYKTQVLLGKISTMKGEEFTPVKEARLREEIKLLNELGFNIEGSEFRIGRNAKLGYAHKSKEEWTPKDYINYANSVVRKGESFNYEYTTKGNARHSSQTLIRQGINPGVVLGNKYKRLDETLQREVDDKMHAFKGDENYDLVVTADRTPSLIKGKPKLKAAYEKEMETNIEKGLYDGAVSNTGRTFASLNAMHQNATEKPLTLYPVEYQTEDPIWAANVSELTEDGEVKTKTYYFSADQIGLNLDINGKEIPVLSNLNIDDKDIPDLAINRYKNQKGTYFNLSADYPTMPNNLYLVFDNEDKSSFTIKEKGEDGLYSIVDRNIGESASLLTKAFKDKRLINAAKVNRYNEIFKLKNQNKTLLQNQ